MKSTPAKTLFFPCSLFPVSCLLLTVFLLLMARPSYSASGGWAATYGGVGADEALSIQQTSDGGYIVASYTESFGAGGGDFWVLKLKADGNVVWQKTYGGSDWDDALSIQQTSDGGYIVAGRTSSFSAGAPGNTLLIAFQGVIMGGIWIFSETSILSSFFKN